MGFQHGELNVSSWLQGRRAQNLFGSSQDYSQLKGFQESCKGCIWIEDMGYVGNYGEANGNESCK